MPATKTIDDGGFPKKIISLSAYDMSLLRSTHSKSNKQLIEAGAAKLVLRYFEHLIDAKARSNPSSLHHVYEFDMAGDKNARLFKGSVNPSPAGAIINFSFINAKQPNRNGYMFYKKAEVMESGQTVTIAPKTSKYLTYRLRDGRFIKTQKPSVVNNPGGPVAGNFAAEFSQFNGKIAQKVLREFRYFEKVNDNIKMKRTRIVPRINALSLSDYANQARSDAAQVAMEANRSVS